MSAAEKSLAALEAARSKGCAGTWVVTSKAHPFASGRAIANFGGDYAEGDDKITGNMSDCIGLAALDRGDIGNEYSTATEDAVCAATCVNLASPLAAVARAAMAYREAMSFRRTKNSESDYVEWSRAVNDENLAQAELFAALDALEAAAEGVL